MNVIKVSNIMGIDPKPFDPKTYVEEDVFVTDESGTKKRIRLEDSIVRWRTIRNADGTTSVSGMLSMYWLVLELNNMLLILGLTLLCVLIFAIILFLTVFSFYLFLCATCVQRKHRSLWLPVNTVSIRQPSNLKVAFNLVQVV